jgi:pimeloyl-ACP methyl ester carboxylesterase
MNTAYHFLALLLVLGALASAAMLGAWLVERAHPAKGRFITVESGRLHVDQLNLGFDGDMAIVLIHGASGNMEDMRTALAAPLDAFKNRFRIVLVDRPGRGWSDRNGPEFSSPQRQADMVAQALREMGVTRAVMVGHSWGGALASAFAIRHPTQTAGLVLLAPTSHPWDGGITWYYTLATLPVIGPLFAYTLPMPLGLLLAGSAADSVFDPQQPPPGYVARSASWLVLRPQAFIANARDIADLKANLEKLVPLYRSITAPTRILIGDRDLTVSNDIHANALAQAISDTELELLEGVGHMPHHARPDRVIAAIEDIAMQAQQQQRGGPTAGPFIAADPAR